MKRLTMMCIFLMLALAAPSARAQNPDDANERAERIRHAREQVQKQFDEREKTVAEAAAKQKAAEQAELDRLKKEQEEKGRRMQRQADERRMREIENRRQQQIDAIARSYQEARRRQEECARHNDNDVPTTWTRFSGDFVPHQIFRGDMLTIDGVAVTWEFTDADKATTDSLGRLRFKSADKSAAIELNGETFREDRPKFYMAPVAFSISEEGPDRTGHIPNLTLGSAYQPDRVVLTGSPEDFVLHVSATNPVLVQQDLWSISQKPKTYSDGTKINQLEIRDVGGKLKAEIPLTRGSFKEVGRYYIRVNEFHELTGTVALGVQARLDPTLKGRWGYVSDDVNRTLYRMMVNNTTFGELMKTFSDALGIHVTYKEVSGDPKSIAYLQKYSIRRSSVSSSNSANETVRIMCSSYNFPFDYEWKSNTELVVWARDYDKILAEEKDQREIKKQNDEVLKKFDAGYQLVTKIYPTKNISISTANILIARELHEYGIAREDARPQQYKIVTGLLDRRDLVRERDSVQEKAIADDRSNSLIVTAIPATQEKIAALLEKIDRSVAPDSGQVPDQFQVEVILLRGDAAGTSTLPSYLNAGDLEPLSVKSVAQIGRATVNVIGEKSELGRAQAALGDGYGVELAFQDFRNPYLILRGTLIANNVSQETIDKLKRGGNLPQSWQPPESQKTRLLENTIFLKSGKPSLLGVTNMRESLILVVRSKESITGAEPRTLR